MQRRAARADMAQREAQHRQARPDRPRNCRAGTRCRRRTRSRPRGCRRRSPPTPASSRSRAPRAPRPSQAEALTQARGDHPGPQHVLHRLTHPEVGRQRERAATSSASRSPESGSAICRVNPGRRTHRSFIRSQWDSQQGGHHDNGRRQGSGSGGRGRGLPRRLSIRRSAHSFSRLPRREPETIGRVGRSLPSSPPP